MTIFLASWAIWAPGVLAGLGLFEINASVAILLRIFGAAVPAAVVLVMRAREGGRPAVAVVIRSSFAVRRRAGAWALLSFAVLVAHGATHTILLFQGMELRPSLATTNPVAILPMAILYFLLGGGLDEEIAWRGTLLGMLRERFSLPASAVMLGIVWILWHLPLFAYPGAGQSVTPFWLFVIPVLPLSVLLAYGYDRIGTIFSAALIHTVGNISFDLFPIEPSGLPILGLFYALIAVALIARHKKTSRKEI